jgi:hypothetical protein
VLLVCFSVVPATFAQSQQTHSALDLLGQLEQRAGLQPPPYVSVVQRIAVLEQRVFGHERTGSIVHRLEALRHAAASAPVMPLPSGSLPRHPHTAMPVAPGAPNTAFPGAPAQAVPHTPAFPATPTGSLPGAPGGLQAEQIHTCTLHKTALGDALPLVNGHPPNFVRVDMPGFPIAASDFYQDVFKSSKNKVVRFKSMPIPVYITPYSDVGFMTCMRRAFDTWEESSDGLVRFVEVDKPGQARIQVVWKRLGQKGDIADCTLGAQTIMKYSDRGRGSLAFMSVSGVPVPVYIPRIGPKYVVPPQVIEVNLDLIMSRDSPQRYRLLQNISTHELGHALGMLGHSPFKADMMNAITDEHSRLSKRDVNTLILLYSRKCDVPL